jgi:hypothetical protein
MTASDLLRFLMRSEFETTSVDLDQDLWKSSQMLPMMIKKFDCTSGKEA